jgi:hypothetical protein
MDRSTYPFFTGTGRVNITAGCAGTIKIEILMQVPVVR